MLKPHRPLPTTLLVLSLLCFGRAFPARGQESMGPLRVGEQNPLYRLFYVPVGEPADLLPAGALQVEVLASYASIFERSHSESHAQLFDMERLTSVLVVRAGVSPWAEVGLALPAQTNWEGFLDPIIEGYHEALNLPDGEREEVPNGAFEGYLRDGGGITRLEIGPRSFAPEDLRLFAKFRLSAREERALSLRLAVKLPTGADGTGTGRADAALEVVGRRSWGAWHLHGSVGAATLRPPPQLESCTSDAALLVMVGVERSLLPSLSLLAQMATGSRYVGGFGVPQLDRLPAVLSVGAAGRLSEGWRWEVGFSEDVPPDGPSVDFTVNVGIARRW